MAAADSFRPPEEGSATRRRLIAIIGGLLLVALLVFAYLQLTAPITKKVKPDQTITAAPDLLPPPPPPPPPPPEPQQEKPPEPSETPAPSPEPQAKPDAPAPMQMDAAASAGTDSFGLQAGSGAGMGGGGAGGTCLKPPCGVAGGGGINDRLYQSALKRAIQARISGDRRVNKFVFTNDFAIVVSASGRVGSVNLRNGSGKTNVDQMLKEILEGMTVPAPPVKSQYPIVIQVRGRNQFGG